MVYLSFLLRRRRKTTPIIFCVCIYVFLCFLTFGWKDQLEIQPDSRYSFPWSDVEISERKQKWLDIKHPVHKMSIYRAYSFHNNKSPPQEVIVVASHFSKEITVSCQFHYYITPYKKAYVKVAGNMSQVPGSGSSFPGNFVKCRIPKSTLKMPSEVAVLLGNQSESPSRVPIQYQVVPSEDLESDEHYPYRFQFSVCVMPIYNFNHVLRFLEWLEFYKLMGVQQFTFFDISIGPELKCVINKLQNSPQEGVIIDVESWREYPFRRSAVPASLGHGLEEATNDCILRNKGVSKYLVMADLDEFIMLSEAAGLRNYNDLIKTLDLDRKNHSVKFGEYRFRNAFFDKAQPNDKLLDARCKPLNGYESIICHQLLMTKFVERNDFDMYWWRTKYICRPDGVEVGKLHWVDVLKKGYESNLVSEKLAFSRHYYEVKRLKLINSMILDRVSEEFGVTLAKKVGGMLEYFNRECKLNSTQFFN